MASHDRKTLEASLIPADKVYRKKVILVYVIVVSIGAAVIGWGLPWMQEVLRSRSTEDALATFDKNVADARIAISNADDEHLLSPWSLEAGGKPVFTMPRIGVIRSMVMNHMIHHRAQLGLYLRLNNLAVPAMYGPTADEA